MVNLKKEYDKDAVAVQEFTLDIADKEFLVYENMAFALKLKKIPKVEIQEKVQEAAEILGITEYLKRKPKTLSGGQRQRVAI